MYIAYNTGLMMMNNSGIYLRSPWDEKNEVKIQNL